MKLLIIFYSQDNDNPYSGINPDLSLYPEYNYELTMERLHNLPQLPNFKPFIGPMGYFNLYVGEGVPRQILVKGFGLAYRANTGNSNIPADDRNHKDNYRVRNLTVSNLNHVDYYTYPQGAPAFGLLIVLNINDLLMYTDVVEPGERVNLTPYEYILDVRYIHDDCLYRFWANDFSGQTLVSDEFVTRYKEGDTKTVVFENNYQLWELPTYIGYLIDNANYSIQSGTKVYNEISNIDFNIRYLEYVTSENDEIVDVRTIDLNNISKLTTTQTIYGPNLIFWCQYNKSLGRWSIYLLKNIGSTSFASNSNIDTYIITTINDLDEGNIEFELYTDNGYLFFKGDTDYDLSGSKETYNIINISDSNIKFLFNN